MGFFGFFKFPNWDWVFLDWVFFGFFGIGIFWDFFLGFLGFFGFSLYSLYKFEIGVGILFFDDYSWKYSQQSACKCLK